MESPGAHFINLFREFHLLQVSNPVLLLFLILGARSTYTTTANFPQAYAIFYRNRFCWITKVRRCRHATKVREPSTLPSCSFTHSDATLFTSGNWSTPSLLQETAVPAAYFRITYTLNQCSRTRSPFVGDHSSRVNSEAVTTWEPPCPVPTRDASFASVFASWSCRAADASHNEPAIS